MKTRKTTLGMETLADRCMMSASPLGGIAAPTPEPEALTGQTVRLRIAATNNQGRLLVQEEGTAAIELENTLVSSAHGDPTPKVAIRWERIAVPVVEEGATAGGIVTEGQGYGIVVASHGSGGAAGGIVSEAQGYGIR